MSGFLLQLEAFEKEKTLPKKIVEILRQFYHRYLQEIGQRGYSEEDVEGMLQQYLKIVAEQIQSPYLFEPYHKKITEPFNYFQMGLDFFRPLLVKDDSKVLGLDQVEQMEKQLAKGENVVLFANHQIEPDPR